MIYNEDMVEGNVFGRYAPLAFNLYCGSLADVILYIASDAFRGVT